MIKTILSLLTVQCYTIHPCLLHSRLHMLCKVAETNRCKGCVYIVETAFWCILRNNCLLIHISSVYLLLDILLLYNEFNHNPFYAAILLL